MSTDNLSRTHVLISSVKLAGNINDLKDIAVEIRKLATDAGADLSGNLHDALFQIEVEYQAYHDIDEDDFDVVNPNTMYNKTFTVIEHNGVNFNCRVIPDLHNEGNTLTIGTTELSLSLQEEFGLTLDDCPIDEQIAYYANEDEIELSDKALFDLIYS